LHTSPICRSLQGIAGADPRETAAPIAVDAGAAGSAPDGSSVAVDVGSAAGSTAGVSDAAVSPDRDPAGAVQAAALDSADAAQPAMVSIGRPQAGGAHLHAHPILGGPAYNTSQTVAHPTSDFVATVQNNVVKWDTNNDGVLSPDEIDAAVADPSNTGHNAAALAQLDYLQSQPDFTGFGATDLTAAEQGKVDGTSSADGLVGYWQSRIDDYPSEPNLYGPSGQPSINDIDQGNQGDCYFLPALGSKVLKDLQSVAAIAWQTSDGLPTHHAYTVEGFDPATKTVTIRNPWGFTGVADATKANIKDLGNGSFAMSLDEFQKNFSAIVIGTT
jgi:hypothetical protein